MVPKTSNIEVHPYLDIVRGATYSILLGVFLTSIFKKGIGPNGWWFLVAMLLIAFFVLDGVARFISRDIIRFNYSQQGDILHAKDETVCFILELIGLLFFAYWAYNLLGWVLRQGNNKFGIFFGFFAFTTAFHNLYMIKLDKGILSWKEFLVTALTRNALEFVNIRNRWQALVASKQRKVEADYNIALRALKKTVNNRTNGECFKASELFNRTHKKLVRKYIGWNYCGPQLTLLHFVHINLVVSVFIIVAEYVFDFTRCRRPTLSWPRDFYVILVTIIALVILLDIFWRCYSMDAKDKCCRFLANRRGKELVHLRKYLLGGNFALFFFLIIIYGVSAFYSVAIYLLILEQFLIGIVAIMSAERGEISTSISKIREKMLIDRSEIMFMKRLLGLGLKKVQSIFDKTKMTQIENAKPQQDSDDCDKGQNS